MGLADAVRVCLGKYVTFSGRASRSEFWYFVLAAILLSLAASALDMALFGETETATLSTDTGEAASASVSETSPASVLATHQTSRVTSRPTDPSMSSQGVSEMLPAVMM